MKKYITLILVFVLLCFSGCAKVFDASIFYDTVENADGFSFVINEKVKSCFVSHYEYEGDNQRNIVIPNEYKGYSVTKLGGYHGRGVNSPFIISVSDEYCNTENPYNCRIEEALYMLKDAEIIEINFNLYIGANIEKVNSSMTDLCFVGVNEKGEKIAYHPTVYVICDEENEHFYSENGKLYKKDGTLVVGFAYSENMAQ